MHGCGNERPGKAEWRKWLTARRAEVSVQQRVSEASALATAVAEITAEVACCYLPFGTEPGSLALLDMLRERGTRVLLPVVPREPGPLDWAEYTGTSSLVNGRFRGLLEPSGTRLGPAALGTASLVLVPALAVDHSGVRLGRGAGYYDRSLGFAAPEAQLVAVVRDAELVEQLPAEEHDIRMAAALTPGRGIVRLPYPDPV
ncbi:5-formyltetrahydrofolate cyclo-ligase [Amycolatopsis aidingensis]|uniref:5-formyltetrahydrofolate cyclo-ligase n=1 Tax=Amycolatopsis aidingensis TaxID=2842453 RepID=UPI001C0E5646|nr:5-formyltetrahydrofolate cyclo-ligase [Amycolatopsis aidingensis]